MQKICAVVYIGRQAYSVRAAWDKGRLQVMKATVWPVTNLDDLRADLQKMHDSGWLVLVDEPTNTNELARFGYRLSLNSLDELSGAPHIVKAVTCYRSLHDRGLITYPAGEEGRYAITDSLIDSQTDDKGQARYRIDWASVTPHHRLTLVCAHAVLAPSVAQKPFFSQLFQSIKTSTSSALGGFAAATVGVDKDKADNGPHSALTGQEIEHGRVL